MATPVIEGMGRLIGKIAFRIKDAETVSGLTLKVGYSAKYCVWVHERTDIHHDIGQAKFLEQPARQYRTQMSGIIVFSAQRGEPMEQCFMKAGVFLLKKSYPLVPVDTGFLRSSGFVKVESRVGGKTLVLAGFSNVPIKVPGRFPGRT